MLSKLNSSFEKKTNFVRNMKSKEVEERKIGGETCPSRPVDSSRIDLYEKDAICVQLASNSILGISYEANTTIFIGCLLQKLVVI